MGRQQQSKRHMQPMAARRGRRRQAMALLVLVPMVLAVAWGAVAAHRAARPQAGASPAVKQQLRPPLALATRTLSAPTRIVPAKTAFPGGLAAGTCLAYRPTRGNKHLTVFVDPGHGGVDPGASGTTSTGVTVDEKDLALQTGLDLLGVLRKDGFTVVMSRVTDTLVMRTQAGDLEGGLLTAAGEHRDIEARIACANAAGAQALVSLHFNADGDPATNGTETIYDAARSFRAANLRLAQLAQRDVLAQLRSAGWAVPDRGVLDDSMVGTPTMTSEAAAYGHLLELGPAAAGWLKQPSEMPGVLCELLFLTHPAEADVAASTDGQLLMATGMAQAITTYFAAARP